MTSSLLWALVVVALLTPEAPRQRSAATTPPAPNAPAVPLLWRIEGTTPAFLFGTIHVPDPEVLSLAPPVKQAFDRAAAVYTEIPLDLGTELALAGQLLLGDDQRLRDVIGDTLFSRLTRAVTEAVSDELPPAGVTLLIGMLDRLKPWAAMAQVALLEYLPEMAAGRQALDAVLYADARAAGKKVGGIETVAEQVAAFDAFSLGEQTTLLRSTLDEVERSRSNGVTPSRQLVRAYRAGNLDQLAKLLDEETDDPVLARKFREKLVVERNHRMADRIAAMRRARPDEAQFFAVGALHLAGAEGVPALLGRQGFRLTRVP